MNRRRHCLLAATALASGLLGVGGAFAQEQQGPETDQAATTAQAGVESDDNVEQVVVTGSRIRRQDIVGVGPATVVTEEQIERSGVTQLETILQQIPASAGFAGSQTAAYWTARGWGTAQVNLRGLGISRTLTLLNGRRLVNGGTGANSSPDLNMIPVSAIERIDVLKDGASAIYGADAVAGVVNLITRTDFEGLLVNAKYGVTQEGDGDDFTADLLWGLRNERGGVSAAFTFQKTEAVNMATRAPCALGEVSGALRCVDSASTMGGRAVLPNGQQINFSNVAGNGNFFEPYSAAKHNFNSNPFLNAVNPLQRFSSAFFADYQLNPAVELFGEFLFTHRETRQIGSPGTLRNLAIPASNPTNPTGQNITLVQRRLAEPGVRNFYQDTDTFQAVGGARGDFWNDWAWESAFSWGRNTGIDGSDNIANLARVRETINTSVCSFAAGAPIPCADYLGFGDISPQALKYILTGMRDTGGNEQQSFYADVTGDLFQMPAGALAVAAGVSYRKEEGWRDPDPLTVQGVLNTNQQTPIRGELAAREAYFEASVPLLRDVPFAQNLTFDAAIRYSDYDLFGSDTNYKLGLDWRVIEGLRMRATYGTGFRVPAIPELFGGVSQGNLTTSDPCSRYSTSANATVRANCASAGVPANYVQLGTTVLTNTGGNIALKPENSESFTVGLVLQPTFLSGFSATVDYFDLQITDAIRSIPGSTKLSVCFNTPGLDHPFCGPSNFTRNTLTGEVNFLSAQLINTGEESVNGWDLGVRYQREVLGRKAQLDWNATYLEQYTVAPFPGAAPIVFDGRIGGGNGGYPHWRSYGSLSVLDPRWTATYSIQWIGEAQDFNAAPTDIGYESPNVFYHNAQFAYELTERARVAVGVDNLFNEEPPFIKSWTDANTDTMTYDLLGRRYYARLTYRFD